MNVTDRAYALELDKNDPLAHFKSQFVVTDPEMCYLDGNSLGRLPKETISAVNNLMTEWGSEVVTGWGHWVDEAQPIPARSRGSMNLRDDKLRQYFYRGEVTRCVKELGDDLGSVVAAGNTGPTAESYVGGGS